MTRTAENRGIAAWPNSPNYERRIAESPICLYCSEHKSSGAMACWWCSGQPEPKPKGPADLRTRVIHVLARHHPNYRHGAVPDDDGLIAWGKTLPKPELLGWRNFGAKSRAWLLAQESRVEVPARTYEQGYRDGVEAAADIAAAVLRQAILDAEHARRLGR